MTLELDFERVIAAPPERVFDAFTSPEGQLEATTESRFEPHENGTRMTMHQAGFLTTALRDEHTRGLPNAFNRLERFIASPNERG